MRNQRAKDIANQKKRIANYPAFGCINPIWIVDKTYNFDEELFNNAPGLVIIKGLKGVHESDDFSFTVYKDIPASWERK